MSLSEKLQQEKEWRDQEAQKAKQENRMATWEADAEKAILKFREIHAEGYWDDLTEEYRIQLEAIKQFKQGSGIAVLLNQAKDILRPSGLHSTLYFPNLPYPYIYYDHYQKHEPHYPYRLVDNDFEEPCIKYEYRYGEIQRFLETSGEERTKYINLAKERPKPRSLFRKPTKSSFDFKYINPLLPPTEITTVEGMRLEWLAYKMSNDDLLLINRIDTYLDYRGNILVKDSLGISVIPFEKPDQNFHTYSGKNQLFPQRVQQLGPWSNNPTLIDRVLGEAYSNPQQSERLPNFADFQN